jgi:hypothetical protein
MRTVIVACLSMIMLLLLWMAACHTEDAKDYGTANTVSRIYGAPDPLRTIGSDTSLLTETLSRMVQQALETETRDRERVLRSDHPADKPMLLEGELFAGLYEGYTEFRVQETVINGEMALMAVRFSNENYNIHWTDTLDLRRSTSWKLHDVRYANGGTLQQTLRAFIAGYQD